MDGNRETLLRTQTEYSVHLTQMRFKYAFNKKASVSSFVQYSNVDELIGGNFRFRYNFSEGRDFWLVFNEQINTVRTQPGMPDLPFSQNTTLLVKYTHTFIF